MPIKLITSGGGSAILTPTTNATDYTLTVPAVTANVATDGAGFYAGYGPAFSAKPSVSQSVTSGTYTKVNLGTENFDTNNCFDNVTNYRFTPNVAGYYQFNALLYQSSSSSANYVWPIIYKNGNLGLAGISAGPASSLDGASSVSGLLYMNGTTDYVELYCYVTGTNPVIDAGLYTVFSGFLARAA